jgi:hypothetical protein
MCESGESCSIKIDSEWIIRGAKSINPHIEFSASEEKWIEQISLHDIGFRRIILIE